MGNFIKGDRVNKYKARRTYSQLCERWFASKAECIRGEELALLERAGEIYRLEYQPKFVLSLKPKISITLDFSYHLRLYNDPIVKGAGDKVGLYGERVYEDVKGVLTRDFRTKLAWLKEKHNVEVMLSR